MSQNIIFIGNVGYIVTRINILSRERERKLKKNVYIYIYIYKNYQS